MLTPALINDFQKKLAHTSRKIAKLEKFVDNGIRRLTKPKRRKKHELCSNKSVIN
jgi:hypothetical protein